MQQINNIRVRSFGDIATPAEVTKKVPITRRARETVIKGRAAIQNILDGEDKRRIVIVGPCSIHDYKAALEYAEKLNKLRKKVEDKMVIVMRVYLEKPRTTVGWKGFIYDPYLDDSYSLAEGVTLARELLVKINDMGLPTGTEVLGPIVIQYYADLICWSAIGARTAESQVHRELASGLSMPVGFKNGTEGNVDIAVNAILAAQSQHHFLGMDDCGRVSVVETTGNPYGHIILRGGVRGPNYFPEDVAACMKFCRRAGVGARILIDCSHANSGKDFRNQEKVWKTVWGQILGDERRGMKRAGSGVGGGRGLRGGDASWIDGGVGSGSGAGGIMGIMLESNLNEGSQKITEGWGELKYGVSITDGCIGWKETERLILGMYGEM